jgi:choline dehydrogenase-like flavoprotein
MAAAMLLDARGAGRARFARRFDFCVVGSGPAGMTLARVLAARGFDVALMEAGGLEVAAESQEAYAGESVGLPYLELDGARLRCFGGSSEHWNGRCRAFDAEDFAARPARPLAWPIARADLDPYAAPAAAILDLAPAEAEPAPAADPVVAASGGALRTVTWRRSPPTRFAEKYRDEVAASPRIAAGLNASLVDLRLDEGLGAVTAAVFSSGAPGDSGFAVAADAYCLCAGGLENPRLLLNAASQIPAGIGNRNDLVGRYFCEHPALRVGRVVLKAKPDREKFSFAPTPALLEREGLLDFHLLLEARAGTPQPLGRALALTAQCLDPFAERLAREALGHWPKCRAGGIDEFLVRYEPGGHPWGWVVLDLEQALDRESRVTLGEERDAFGLRRIRLDWRLGERDYATMARAVGLLGEYLAGNDIGRLKVADWLLEARPVLPDPSRDLGNGSCHHMCTTRMSDDPRTGVVDRDCRVHGLSNLYVGGSSVFATPGFVNPTLTIVQLALRLADHLSEVRHVGAQGTWQTR